MRILVPTDGSEYSEAAAKFLLRLNLSSHDAISILHVISEDPFQDSDDYYVRRVREVKNTIAPTIIDNLANILREVPARVDKAVATGCPDTCIIEASIRQNSDLIVMGPKRVKGIRSHIVGSITKSVSINSPKPILVIKPPRDGMPKGMKILFSTDGSAYAMKAGELLMSMPLHDDTEITVLRVITPAFYDIPEQFMVTVDTRMKEDLKNLMDREAAASDDVVVKASNYLRSRFSRVHSLTKTGDPTDEILQTAYDLQSDIIVLGSKGMGGLRGVIDSISRYILSVADCSVLIGKT